MRQEVFDGSAIGASALCLIHCLLPLLASAGLLFLIAALLPAAVRGETLLTVAGSLLLALGHILNWRAAAFLRW